MSPFQIAIDAQLAPARGTGGIESVLIGIIHSLGKLTDGDETYTVIGPWAETDWLKPYLGPNQKLVRGPRPVRRAGPVKRVLRRWLLDERESWFRGPHIPVSDGYYERLRCEVIHFPTNHFVVCSMPSV